MKNINHPIYDMTEHRQREGTQHFLASVVESSKDSIVTIDFERIITSWNKAAEELYGYSAAEVLGKPLTLLTLPEDFQEVLSNIDKIKHSEPVELFDTVRLNKDGREMHLEVVLSPVKDMAGQVIGVSAIARDITERKQLDQASQVNDERFSSAFEYAGIGMALVDLDGRCFKVNRSLCDLLGYSAEELCKLTLQEITHPDDLNADLENMRALLANEIASYSMEKRYYDKQGGVIWGLLSASLIRDRDGEPLYFIGQLQDISERKRAEETLLHSEERYRSLVLATSQIVWTVSADGIVGDMPAWNSFTGQSLEESRDWGWTEAIHPDDRERTTKLWTNCVETKSLFETEYRLRAANGRYRLFTVRGVPIVEDDGNVREWVGTFTDIHDLKQAEAALQKAHDSLEARVEERTAELQASTAALRSSEAQFRMLTEVMPQIVWAAQPDGFIDYYNRQWVEYTGMTIEQTQGWGWQPVVHPDDLENSVAVWTEAMRTGEGCEIEYRFKRASDGTYRWHLGRALPLRDEAGNITKWFGTATDIDDQKRTSETLREAQQMLQLVMNHIPQAIFWKDRNSIIMGGNYRFAQDAGFNSPEEVIGKDDFEIWPGNDQVVVYQADDQQVMAMGESKLDIEEPLTKPDGSNAWLRTNKIPLYNAQGQVMGVLGTYEDITVQKESEAAINQAREEAERANAAKGEFLSRMSHEMRTPLNAILGFGQILELQAKQLTELQNESVQHILKAGQNQLALVDEVLDITRIQAPDSALSLESVALGEVVQEALGMLQALAAPAEISLTQQLGDAPSIFVLADRQRLLQILTNLLSNAIKYNKPGGQVSVSAEVLAKDRVRFHVRDTGHGIAAEDFSKLFVPFARLNADELGVEGTGLGLVLCQRLAHAMNGSLHVESQPGQGSTFSVELPLAQPPAETEDTKTESAELIPSAPSTNGAVSTATATHTILLIEDNISNFQLIKMLLDDLDDVRLVGAMQGGRGLELALHEQPDLILLDLHLPDIMGDEVLRRLQANPETQNIPVIILSADAMSSQINRLLALGARQYLTKPLDVKQFFSVLENTLKKETIDHATQTH